MRNHIKYPCKLFMMFTFVILVLLSNNFQSHAARPSARNYKCGPSGGYGGTYFEDSSSRINTRVIEVAIRAGRYIDSLQMIHMGNNQRYPLNKHGGNGGRLFRFRLERGEYITAISGRYGRFVDSIIIHTNKRSSPRYGGTGGASQYIYEAPSGKEIVGFLGRSGNIIDAIGVIIR